MLGFITLGQGRVGSQQLNSHSAQTMLILYRRAFYYIAPTAMYHCIERDIYKNLTHIDIMLVNKN